MDTSNLAAVFCPGILRHPDHNTPVQYKISQYVIEFLIEYQSLFTMQLLMSNNEKKSSPGGSSNGDVPPVPLLLPSSYKQKEPPAPLHVVNPSIPPSESSSTSTSATPTPSFSQSPLDIVHEENTRGIQDSLESSSSSSSAFHKLTNITKPHLKRMGENLTELGHQVRPWIGKKKKKTTCTHTI